MKFSVIVPHYDGSINDEIFCRGIQCLIDQTNQDFELLIYHDGPVSRPIPDLWRQLGDRAKLDITKKRENNWGHGNRDRGIKKAKGDYIIHHNPDNILYNFALEELEKESNKNYGFDFKNDIIIFPVYMIGMTTNGKFAWRDKLNRFDYKMILTGFPGIKNFIDAMQLVMKTDLWNKYNGWYDKSETSDGTMYEKFVHDNGARYCSKILGEHR